VFQASDSNERLIQAFDLLGVRVSSVQVSSVQVSSVQVSSVRMNRGGRGSRVRWLRI
jgi:hypothetical protein